MFKSAPVVSVVSGQRLVPGAQSIPPCAASLAAAAAVVCSPLRHACGRGTAVQVFDDAVGGATVSRDGSALSAGVLLRNVVNAEAMADPEPAVQALLQRCAKEHLMMVSGQPGSREGGGEASKCLAAYCARRDVSYRPCPRCALPAAATHIRVAARPSVRVEACSCTRSLGSKTRSSSCCTWRRRRAK